MNEATRAPHEPGALRVDYFHSQISGKSENNWTRNFGRVEITTCHVAMLGTELCLINSRLRADVFVDE